jgi:hypothetical protein
VKQATVIAGGIVFAALAWLLGSRLSADALGMAVGLVFGVLACIPTALLVLATERRHGAAQREEYQPSQPAVVVIATAASPRPYPETPAQITNNYYGPVQINAAPAQPAAWQPPTVQLAQQPALPGPQPTIRPWVDLHPDQPGAVAKFQPIPPDVAQSSRQFRIVGMTEEVDSGYDW